MALGFGTKMCWGEREREGFSAVGECWWLTKSHSNILFCWLPPSLIIFWILRSWTVPHRLIMSPESALPTNRCFPCSLWRLFVAALIHQMCLFCTLMFVFSALLVLSNSSEQGGCCWIVRIEVGCWLEVTVNGLVVLTRDILRNTKDVAFTFLGEGAERERECVWMNGLRGWVPRTVPLEMTDWLFPHPLVARATMASDFILWLLTVCLAHPCMQGNTTLPLEELLISVLGHLGTWDGHNLSRLSKGTCSSTASSRRCMSRLLCSCSPFEPALALVWLEGKSVCETELEEKKCYKETIIIFKNI